MLTKLESSDLMLLVTICGAVTVLLTFNPPVENMAMFGIPPTATVILPSDTAIETFDVPLEILLEIATTPVKLAPLPKK